MRAPGWRNR